MFVPPFWAFCHDLTVVAGPQTFCPSPTQNCRWLLAFGIAYFRKRFVEPARLSAILFWELVRKARGSVGEALEARGRGGPVRAGHRHGMIAQ